MQGMIDASNNNGNTVYEINSNQNTTVNSAGYYPPSSVPHLNMTSSSVSEDQRRRITLPSQFSPEIEDDDNESSKKKAIRSAEVQQKLNNMKVWSINTYKCSKQLLNEKLGRSTKTVDLELEKKIELLIETQAKYNRILVLSKSLKTHMFNAIQTQKSMIELFSELSFKQPELQEPFTSNSNTQKSLVKNGQKLLSAINFFTDAMDTLVNKTMQDTLNTVKQYQSARVQYDAYRNEAESQASSPNNPNGNGASDHGMDLEQHKHQFESLHKDVDVKIQLLNENKIRVMSRQLKLFEIAFASFMSGNEEDLDSVLKQFKVKVTDQSDSPSFLEFS